VSRQVSFEANWVFLYLSPVVTQIASEHSLCRGEVYEASMPGRCNEGVGEDLPLQRRF